MAKIKANSVLIQNIRDTAKLHFPENAYKFFWDKDDLCLYFKKDVDFLSAQVFASLTKQFNPGLSVTFKVLSSESEFWD